MEYIHTLCNIIDRIIYESDKDYLFVHSFNSHQLMWTFRKEF